MKSKLFFRHIKHNILKYTVAFSAAVHLIGIFMFPSWGTTPEFLKEKVIKIKTVVEKPEKIIEKTTPESEKKKQRDMFKPKMKPDPITPQNRYKSPLLKLAKAVTPSPAKERIPVPIHHSKQIFLPAKAIQQGISTPHPVASLQNLVEINFSSDIQPSPRREQTETPSPHPTLQRKHFTQVAIMDRPKTPRVTFSGSIRLFSNLNAQSVRISSPARFEEFISIPSPGSEVHIAKMKKESKPNPLILAHNIKPINQATPAAPTRRKSFASKVVSVPKAGINFRSPKDIASGIATQGQRIIPVAGWKISQFPGVTTLMQMASIPAGFSEQTINGISKTPDKIFSGNNNSTGGTDENSADQMGEIKKAFSSQVWTKIAQSKYYPRLARKRGYEGEPVVDFILGNTGDLLEATIKNPSPHKLLDEAALDAVKSASPYPPIPELLQMKTIRFKLPISFILEEP